MLIMLGQRRNKAFPKILAIIESVLRSPFGQEHIDDILLYIDFYLKALSEDEERNTYLISWLAYFVVSNRLKHRLTFTPAYKNAITRSVFNNRGNIFRDSIHFKIFEGCCAVATRGSMLEYLEIFDPTVADMTCSFCTSSNRRRPMSLVCKRDSWLVDRSVRRV